MVPSDNATAPYLQANPFGNIFTLLANGPGLRGLTACTALWCVLSGNSLFLSNSLLCREGYTIRHLASIREGYTSRAGCAMPEAYDAFGVIGTTSGELDWKMPIFFERAVPIHGNPLLWRRFSCNSLWSTQSAFRFGVLGWTPTADSQVRKTPS